MGLVSKVTQLASLSPAAIEWLGEHLEQFSFKKGDILLKPGKVCQYLYYVNSGMLGGYTLVNEQEICNWISVENDFATSFYSFISLQPSAETIESFENSQVQAISYHTLHELYRLFPESERAGRLILEEYYMRLEERLLSIQFKQARERYQLLHGSRPELIRRAPLGRVATYLGMKQETLSRIRAEK